MTLLYENRAIVFNVFFLCGYELLWRHFPFSKNDKGKATISKELLSRGHARDWIKRSVFFLVAWLSERISITIDGSNRTPYVVS